jgi:hypothetical protein
MRTGAALVFFALAATAFPQANVLNVSHDLVTLGIASQNMIPDMATLDSRPLLEAAVQYAQVHNVPAITSDPGAYYFLTARNPGSGRYLNFQGLKNLTFDFGGSDFYFKSGSWVALE